MGGEMREDEGGVRGGTGRDGTGREKGKEGWDVGEGRRERDEKLQGRTK